MIIDTFQIIYRVTMTRHHHHTCLVFILLYKIAQSLPAPVKNGTEPVSIADKLLIDVPENSCSLDIQNVDKEIFKSLCGDKTVPNVTNVNDDKFIFDFPTYLCYTVYHNMRALCNSQHNQKTFTPVTIETDPQKFCSSIPKISISNNCTSWLEDPQKRAEDDCVLVNRVVGAIMDKDEVCKEQCIKQKKLDPICTSLVETSLILAEISNKSVAPISTATQLQTNVSVTIVDQKNSSTAKIGDQKAITTKQQEAEKTKKITESTAEVTTTSSAATVTEEETKEDTAKAAGEKVEETGDGSEDDEAEVTDEAEETLPATTDSEIEPLAPKDEEQFQKQEKQPQKQEKEREFYGSISNEPDIEAESHFLSYFLLLSIVAIVAYLVFHNKQKVPIFL